MLSRREFLVGMAVAPLAGRELVNNFLTASSDSPDAEDPGVDEMVSQELTSYFLTPSSDSFDIEYPKREGIVQYELNPEKIGSEHNYDVFAYKGLPFNEKFSTHTFSAARHPSGIAIDTQKGVALLTHGETGVFQSAYEATLPEGSTGRDLCVSASNDIYVLGVDSSLSMVQFDLEQQQAQTRRIDRVESRWLTPMHGGVVAVGEQSFTYLESTELNLRRFILPSRNGERDTIVSFSGKPDAGAYALVREYRGFENPYAYVLYGLTIDEKGVNVEAQHMIKGPSGYSLEGMKLSSDGTTLYRKQFESLIILDIQTGQVTVNPINFGTVQSASTENQQSGALPTGLVTDDGGFYWMGTADYQEGVAKIPFNNTQAYSLLGQDIFENPQMRVLEPDGKGGIAVIHSGGFSDNGQESFAPILSHIVPKRKFSTGFPLLYNRRTNKHQ